MANIGFYSYNDLYNAKPEIYSYYDNYEFPPPRRIKILPMPEKVIGSVPTTMTTTTPVTTTYIVNLTSLSTMKSSTKLYELTRLIPFVYFHWFLIGLAILFALLLLIIFICYCHNYCRKVKKSRNEAKQPLPNFYRYQKINGSFHTNIYETTTPHHFPSPKRPSLLNSKEYLDNSILRQNFGTVDSPQMLRANKSQTKLPSPYSNVASNLLTEMKTRLDTRSSETSLKIDRLCEIPVKRTHAHLNAEPKHDAVLIDMN